MVGPSPYGLQGTKGVVVLSEEFIVSVTLPGTPEHFTRACSGAIRVGRSPDVDLQLVHPLVSRLHAPIEMQDDGTFVVSDLGSSNGTVVNDQMLKDGKRETTGETSLQIGPYVLRLSPGQRHPGRHLPQQCVSYSRRPRPPR